MVSTWSATSRRPGRGRLVLELNHWYLNALQRTSVPDLLNYLKSILVAATLESAFAFCLGCKVFGMQMRMGVIPQEVCAACADISVCRASAS